MAGHVGLPFEPTLKPMLARLARHLPRGDYLYEPKWDGFRALVYRAANDVDIRSRHGRPLSRYFPELVDGVRSIPVDGLVLDGEIVPAQGADFPSLMLRLHPAASRVARLSAETPVSFVAFDLLACGGRDLREKPFAERRRLLEAVLSSGAQRVVLSPMTESADVASAWLAADPAGVDGVVAKERTLTYQPGKRAMVKVKRERTADCVVAGFRVLAGVPRVGSLLLGLYEDRRVLRHVGVASGFAEATRHELLVRLQPLIASLDEHPWRQGFGLDRSPTGRLAGSAGRWEPGMSMDWVPIRPALVAEVAFDALDGMRFRHPARFRRWRTDRTPSSCTLEQLEDGIGR